MTARTRFREIAEPVAFKAFRSFNAPELRHLAGMRGRIGSYGANHFQGPGLPDRIVRALAARFAVDAKEVFESFELLERVRHRVRAPVLADLCCGHGLTGLLFAAFERRVERVLLVDHARPKSHDNAYEAVVEAAPWVADKVEYIEAPLAKAASVIPDGAAIVAIHACGVRTDRCLDIAIARQGPIAVMPCCYHQTADPTPRALRRALGEALATDVHRTYRLEAAGYDTDWTAVPAEITPMNRVIVATPKRTPPAP